MSEESNISDVCITGTRHHRGLRCIPGLFCHYFLIHFVHTGTPGKQAIRNTSVDREGEGGSILLILQRGAPWCNLS